MKRYSALRFTFLIVVIVLITSCKDEEPINPIVGKWEFSEVDEDADGEIVYSRTILLTFNADNTGLEEIDYIIYGQPDSSNSNIVWLAKNGILTLFYGAEPTDYPYSISDNELTIVYPEGAITYTKVD